jgi:hypothetical protein
MDSKSANNSMSSQKSWRVVLWLSGFLGHAEREAVLGDLSESGESGGKAVANVLGLVVRRQTVVLLDLRLWLAVAFVVLPISYMLSAITQATAGQGAVYSWMYLNNWDWTITRNPGFWHVLREMAMNFGVACLILACWSWSAGFLIGRFPNSVSQAGRNTFVVLIAASFLVDAPARFINFWMFLRGLPLRPLLPDYNAPVTANVFYHLFFPWIVLAILVILPAFSGIRQGNRSSLLERKMRVALVTATSISVLIMLTHVPGIGLLLGERVMEWLWRNRNAMQVLPLLCCWPMFYLAVAFVRYRRRKSSMAQQPQCT